MTLEKIKKAPALHAVALLAVLSISQPTLAYERAGNTPSGIAMAADLVVGRPVLLATTAVGTAVWLVALPFSALGGNIKESASQLVVGPARATFLRCLGCNSGNYTE